MLENIDQFREYWLMSFCIFFIHVVTRNWWYHTNIYIVFNKFLFLFSSNLHYIINSKKKNNNKNNFFTRNRPKNQTNKQTKYYQDNMDINMFTVSLLKPPSHPVAFSLSSKTGFMVEIIITIIIMIMIIVMMYKILAPVFIFSEFLEEMIN